MSYNRAALYGGSIQDSINALGGWAVPGMTAQSANLSGITLQDPGFAKVLARIQSDYNVPASSVRGINDIIEQAYAYDSALMLGNDLLAKTIRQSVKNAGPDTLKLFNYVRRIAHRGDSTPQKIDAATRKAATDALRATNRATLLANPWWGSDEYTGQGSRTKGFYKYLSPVEVRRGGKGSSFWRSFGVKRKPNVKAIEGLLRWLRENAAEPSAKKERMDVV